MESRTRINHCPLTTSPPRRYGLYLSLLSGIAALFILVTASPAAEGETLKLTHLRTLTNDFAITTLAWHPDGKQLAVGQVLNKRVAIWDTRTGERVRTLEKEGGGVRTLTYSPDGKYLAVGREFSRLTQDRAHVHLYDAATGDLLQRFPPSSSSVRASDAEALTFSPDSRYLAVSGHGSRMNGVIYSIANHDVAQSLPDAEGTKGHNVIQAISFSPDGQFVALGKIGGQIDIWSRKTGKLVKRLEAQSGGVHALAFSPDGKYLASGTNVGERWDWGVKPARQTFGQFKDDVVLWSVPTFEKSLEFPSRRFKKTPNSNIIESLQFSPDSRWLIVGARAKSVEIIDLFDRATALYKEGFPAVAEVALSPNGKYLAIGLGKKIEVHELITP